MSASQTPELNSPPHLLILEDDLLFRETLSTEFTERAYKVCLAEDEKSLLNALNEASFDYALVDLRLKESHGLDFIPLIREHSPSARIIVLTGHSSIATAVEAVKRGANDYLVKPVPFTRLEQVLTGSNSPSDLPLISEYESESNSDDFESLDQHEQEYLEYVMLKSEGNISKAAKWLKIHRQSLQRKLKRIGLR